MLQVDNLLKTFSTSHGVVRALDSVSFALGEGETLSLVGPSGCGKTTCLRMIAGLETPDGGTISINGETVFDAAAGINVPAFRRPIAMVFQSYAIWPHMTVYENVSYPLKVGKERMSRAQMRERVLEVLRILRIEALIDRNATALSGGQQQRVAVARALVRRPKLLLLDEPLSNLDAQLREAMRFEFREIFARSGTTAVYVTHDLGEALVLSSRINVMNHGQIVQTGAPRDVFFQPRHPFVAEFMGGGNIFRGRVSSIDGGADGRTGELDLGFARLRCRLVDDIDIGADVMIAVRPSDISIAPRANGSGIAGTVQMAAFVGSSIEYRVRIDAHDRQLRIQAPYGADSDWYPEDSEVSVAISGLTCAVIPVRE
ncbi:MAG: ABC transporter ATP-binding protein [Alphaproteobacteria bacterium]